MAQRLHVRIGLWPSKSVIHETIQFSYVCLEVFRTILSSQNFHFRVKLWTFQNICSGLFLKRWKSGHVSQLTSILFEYLTLTKSGRFQDEQNVDVVFWELILKCWRKTWKQWCWCDCFKNSTFFGKPWEVGEGFLERKNLFCSFFGHVTQHGHVGSLFLDQGLNLHPLHWKHSLNHWTTSKK